MTEKTKNKKQDEEKTQKGSEKKKYNSRKFIVWIAASIFQATSLLYALIAKDPTLAVEFAPWWGGVSMLYIGGNVAQQFAKPQEQKDEE